MIGLIWLGWVTEAVGDAERHMVGPKTSVSSEPPQVRVIGRKAQLVVAEQRDVRADMAFKPDQPFDIHTGQLIVKRVGLCRPSAPHLDMGRRLGKASTAHAASDIDHPSRTR